MIPTVRLFESEGAAQDAAAKLAEIGLEKQSVLLPSSLAGEAEKEGEPPSILEGEAEKAVWAAAEAEHLPSSYIAFCIHQLQAGRSVVAVRVDFGRGLEASEIMENCGAVDSDTLPPLVARDPSPFSDFLGIPTLVKFVPMTELKSSDWTLSGLFGLGLLSDKAAPLSGMFGMKTLSPTKRPWTTSVGLPLLSNKAAPLSGMFGMKTLTSPKRSWTSSFGFPLLSRNPAPLSALFGMPTKTKDD